MNGQMGTALFLAQCATKPDIVPAFGNGSGEIRLAWEVNYNGQRKTFVVTPRSAIYMLCHFSEL